MMRWKSLPCRVFIGDLVVVVGGVSVVAGSDQSMTMVLNDEHGKVMEMSASKPLHHRIQASQITPFVGSEKVGGKRSRRAVVQQ